MQTSSFPLWAAALKTLGGRKVNTGKRRVGARMKGSHTGHFLGLSPATAAGGGGEMEEQGKKNRKVYLPYYCSKLITRDFTMQEIKRTWPGGVKQSSCTLPGSLLICLMFNVSSYRLLKKALWREVGRRATCSFIEHLLGVRLHAFGQEHRWVR